MFFQYFLRFITLILPACLTFFLMIVSALPFPFIQGLNPWLGLLSILFWAQVQPRMMPWWLALGLGAFHDLWTAMPLPTALAFFPFCVLILRQWHLESLHSFWRFVNIPVLVGVLLFALVVWTSFSFSLHRVLSPVPVLWSALLSLAFYPLVHNFLLVFYAMTLQTTSYRSKLRTKIL